MVVKNSVKVEVLGGRKGEKRAKWKQKLFYSNIIGHTNTENKWTKTHTFKNSGTKWTQDPKIIFPTSFNKLAWF